MTSLPTGARRVVNALRLVSLLDGLMLVVLIRAAVMQNEEVVAVLGPTHGLLFLVLVATLAWAARRRWWSWWLVGAVAVLGPLASIPGLEREHRRGYE